MVDDVSRYFVDISLSSYLENENNTILNCFPRLKNEHQLFEAFFNF